MPTLLLRFPGRRYHATPWGHHVNEGLVEWPPSPWRLLRALIATGYAKLGWSCSGPPPVARSLLDKLASVLPRYRLPEAVATHSRHYMPMARFKNGQEETTLVFDTWAEVGDGELAVRWATELDAEEFVVLGALARELGYLGRSESWVDAHLTDDTLPESVFDVRAGDSAQRPGTGWEQVPLLSPVSESDYMQWRHEAVRRAIETIPPADAKGNPLTEGQRRRREAEVQVAHPAGIIECLQIDTRWLHELGWSQPPGTRKVFYWRRDHSLESIVPRREPRTLRAPPVECMLLAMATANGNRHALPLVTRALPQAEILHGALNFHAARTGGHSIVLSGCDEHRNPLRTPHQHAHLLHLDLDGDGRLDHVLIWAPMGLDAHAQAAVRAVRRTFTKGSNAPLRIGLVAEGSLDEIEDLPEPLGSRLQHLTGNDQKGAQRWISITPFVPPRHLKRNGRNTLECQIAAEMQARSLPVPTSVRVLSPQSDEAVPAARHFVRRRRGGPQPPVDHGFMLELTFSERVHGPVALGYGSHFGLGMFGVARGETLYSDRGETPRPH